MSYILDALKKIEHEKSKKAQTDGKISISGDLFRERTMPPPRTGIGKIASVVAIAVLLACAGTWYVLRGTTGKGAAVTRSVVPPPPAPEAPTAAPAPAQMPASPTPSAVSAQSLSAASGLPVRADSAGVPVAAPRPVKQLKHNLTPSAVVTARPPVQLVQAPADIKLSGIAWQDERAARRAVINGYLLKEGAVVSGAKIADIQADRVRFSSAAGQFELRLDAVVPAEVKK